jgi:hypothetical protein
MALKVGKLRMFKGIGSIPYTVYDGYEAWPVIVGILRNRIPIKYRWSLYDKYGYHGLGRAWGVPDPKMFFMATAILMGGEKNLKKYDILIKNELKHLDKLWLKDCKCSTN